MSQPLDFNSELLLALPKVKSFMLAKCKNPEELEDILQETVLRALSHKESFTLGTSMRKWLNTIAFNIFINLYRHEARVKMVFFEDLENLRTINPSADHSIELKEVFLKINSLSSRDRKIITLALVEGHKYEYIAATLKMPLGTVRSALSRSRQKVFNP